VLKGGLFLYGRYREAARPTQDIDLHARALRREVGEVLEAVRAVIGVDLAAQDAIRFDPEALRVEAIQVEADYPGVRLRLEGTLGKAREVLWLDVSFGNVITPGPVELDFPTLLAAEAPKVLASSFETVLAEKLQAAVVLGTANSRAKDFYDLLQAARQGTFEARLLRDALEATFRRRKTRLEDALGLFTPAFAGDPQMQAIWSRFLQNTQLPAPPSFAEALAIVQAFLEPVLQGTARERWNPEQQRWG
jgi:hypothetical protein